MSRVSSEWMGSANCVGTDPELFFPVRVGRAGRYGAAADARKVCAACTVTAECSEYADLLNLQGIWGGVHHFHTAQVSA